MFKKSDSNQIQGALVVVLAAIIILTPITYLLELFSVIEREKVAMGEIILPLGAIILLMFDIMMLPKKENKQYIWWYLILGVMLVSILLSTIFAEEFELTQAGSYLNGESSFILASYVIVVFSVSMISSDKYKKLLYIVLTIFGFIEIIMALLETVIPNNLLAPIIEEYPVFGCGRALGTVKNQNPFGSLMILFLGLEIGCYFKAENKKKIVFHLVMMMLYAICMILSGTRGALLGTGIAAVGFVIIALICEKKGKKLVDRKKLITLLVIIVSGVLLFSIVKKDQIIEMISRTTSDIENNKLGEDRLLIWQRGWEIVKENPILGKGPGNISILFFRSGEVNSIDDLESLGITNDCHNRYLHIWATQGIVGLLAYIIFLIFVYVRGIRRLKERASDRELIAGILFAVTGYLIADIFCIAVYPVVPYLFMACGYLVSSKDKGEAQ